MKLSFFALFFVITKVFCYLSEQNSPFIISIDKTKLKRGDTIHITWGLTPGVRFPLYGYASARTSKTDFGLLLPESSRRESYLYVIDTDVSVLDQAYTWTITDDVPAGRYQIGIGFFYHETSPVITIIE